MDGNGNLRTMAVDKIKAYCGEKVRSFNGASTFVNELIVGVPNDRQLIGLINSPCGK